MGDKRMDGESMGGASEELARLGGDGLRGECSFDGCGKPVRSRRESLCEAHYYQRRRGQELRPLKPRRKNGEAGVCVLDGCDKPTKGGMCPMHHARNARHGDPNTVIGKDDQKRYRGEDHPRWTDEPGYYALHQRIKKALGRATGYACTMGCGKRASHWALVAPRGNARLHGVRGAILPVGSSVNDYSPLCVRCHKNFDMAWIGTPAEALSALQASEVPQEG